MRRILLATAGAIAILFSGVGCRTDQLETGYKYTPLGDSPARQKAYYAGPFSKEAREAQAENRTETEERRVRPGM